MATYEQNILLQKPILHDKKINQCPFATIFIDTDCLFVMGDLL